MNHPIQHKHDCSKISELTKRRTLTQGLVAEYGMNRKLSSAKRIDSNVDSLKEGETGVGR